MLMLMLDGRTDGHFFIDNVIGSEISDRLESFKLIILTD